MTRRQTTGTEVSLSMPTLLLTFISTLAACGRPAPEDFATQCRKVQRVVAPDEAVSLGTSGRQLVEAVVGGESREIELDGRRTTLAVDVSWVGGPVLYTPHHEVDNGELESHDFCAESLATEVVLTMKSSDGRVDVAQAARAWVGWVNRFAPGEGTTMAVEQRLLLKGSGFADATPMRGVFAIDEARTRDASAAMLETILDPRRKQGKIALYVETRSNGSRALSAGMLLASW